MRPEGEIVAGVDADVEDARAPRLAVVRADDVIA
jgi:hypothetical protein